MTTKTEENGKIPFMDNIWLQFAITTGITVVWLIWIMIEILVRG